MQGNRKSSRWGGEEKRVLVMKAFENFGIISSDKKDTESLEEKRSTWDQIAAAVNEKGKMQRTGKDACWKY